MCSIAGQFICMDTEVRIIMTLEDRSNLAICYHFILALRKLELSEYDVEHNADGTLTNIGLRDYELLSIMGRYDSI